MNSLNTASLVNLLGFTVGVALYVLLLVMVAQHRRARARFAFDPLLLATAVLGILWNAGELAAIVWKDFGAGAVSSMLLAISYSALGFLPSVVVHSAEKNSESANVNRRFLTVAAYGLSALATFFHFQSAVFFDRAPSDAALLILTVGALALLAGLLVFNRRQTLENKRVWIAALLIFAVSALHLNSDAEGASWLVELIAHQSSLPLVLAILLQDYRFAFADLFLKRALSLVLVTAAAFGLYVFVAAPLLRYHETHDRNDAQAIGIILTLWVTTALVYPSLHRFAGWLVDKIILRRADYADLRIELSKIIEKCDSATDVLNETCAKLAAALTARQAVWNEKPTDEAIPLPVVFDGRRAKIAVPVVESPAFSIDLSDFFGGRRLLSDEIEMLEAVALLAARRIDALRVTGERFERQIREREFSRLATEAELRALRAQLNPHFLFNALTTVGYLIDAAPEKALATLLKLTALLRRVLKSSGEFSTFDEEIKLVEFYLEIERARFEERLAVEIDVPQDLRCLRVPALILQPLVENAVKHGISKSKPGGKVTISAALESAADKLFLKISVADSGAGAELDEFTRNRQKGFGLNSIEQRLLSHYGDSAVFTIKSRAGEGTTALMKIPIVADAITSK